MKRKKLLSAVLMAFLIGSTFAACGKNHKASETEHMSAASDETADVQKESAKNGTGEALRVGALKGPTSMGLVNLMKRADEKEARGIYEFSISAQPGEIVSAVASGDLDVALLPANMASVLYQKTGGKISVIDINTLGVLYCVTGDDSVRNIQDFAGKTVLTTGQGATPEYVLNYLLKQNEVADCTLEFKSEPTEIAAVLKAEPNRIAVLPQPFATVAVMQNDAVNTAFSLTDSWDEQKNGSRLVTGVTIARREVIENRGEEIKVFIEEHKESTDFANSDPASASLLISNYGILEKAPLAEKALPLCNLVCITGEEMKGALEGYLKTLCEEEPKAVGGKLPADDFYYLP